MLIKSLKSKRLDFDLDGMNSEIISSMSASVNFNRSSINIFRKSYSSIKPSPEKKIHKVLLKVPLPIRGSRQCDAGTRQCFMAGVLNLFAVAGHFVTYQ